MSTRQQHNAINLAEEGTAHIMMNLSTANPENVQDFILPTVKNILQSYGVESTRISLLQKPKEDGFQSHNYVFLVESDTPVHFNTNDFGTSPTDPEGVHKFIFRLANPKAKDLQHANRIQNIVSFMKLARDTMQKMAPLGETGLDTVVPSVHGWKASEPGNTTDPNSWGWIIYEYKKGNNLEELFSDLPFDEKVQIMEQMALVLSALQGIERPQKVAQFGGMSFDATGDTISAGMINLKNRPWDLYSDVWIAKVRHVAEDDFKRRGLMVNWDDSGFIDRLKRFMTSNGLARALNGVDMSQMVIVHGDFNLKNMLYDRETKKITGLLDFDLATITNPADEFFSGLLDIGGGLVDDPCGLLASVLSGDFSKEPEDISQAEMEKWELAKAWQEISKRHGVLTPSTINGSDQLLRLHKMVEELYIPELPGEGRIKIDLKDPNLIQEKEAMGQRIAALIGDYGF